MTAVKFPNVKVKLSQCDGNAFAILGAVGAALRKGGASKEDCNAFQHEATTGDYDHLLQTAMRWVDVS